MNQSSKRTSLMSRIVKHVVAGFLVFATCGQAYSQETITVPADTIDRLNDVRAKLMAVYTQTRKRGTLEEALNSSLSFSVCFPTDVGASAKGGVSLGTKLVAAAGVGAHALGNGVAGWLKTQSLFSPVGLELNSRTNISTFPCLNINELHALHNGDPLFAIDMDILSPWADPAQPPQRSYADSGFPAGSGSRVGTLSGEDSGGVSPAEIINAIVDLHVKAGMNPSDLTDVSRVIMGASSVADAKDALFAGSWTALDHLDSAAGALTTMVDDSIIGPLMAPLLNTASGVSTFPDPCGLNSLIDTFCNGASGLVDTVRDALDAVESFSGVLVDLGPFWPDRTVMEELNNLTTHSIPFLHGQLQNVFDHTTSRAQSLQDQLTNLGDPALQLIDQVDSGVTTLGALLHTVSNEFINLENAVCQHHSTGQSYSGVSVDVTFRPCSSSPWSFSWSGSSPF
jgi:hypothetical protein